MVKRYRFIHEVVTPHFCDPIEDDDGNYVLYSDYTTLEQECERLRGELNNPDAINDGEFLGQIVRMVWIEWAKEQPNPKPSWLVPWEKLSEPDKEVDRRIGKKISEVATALIVRHLEEVQSQLTAAQEARKNMELDIRTILWLGHGHTGLYGDDGELQCGACTPDWDYKRGDIFTLLRKALATLLSRAEKAESDKEVAESVAYQLAHPLPSPCGHSGQYAYTNDGGKTIYCYVCQKEMAEARIEQLEAENRLFQSWLCLYAVPRYQYSYSNTAEEELIAVYDEYIEFLNKANEGPIVLAHVHGWRCDQADIDKGKEYRDKIQAIKKSREDK